MNRPTYDEDAAMLGQATEALVRAVRIYRMKSENQYPENQGPGSLEKEWNDLYKTELPQRLQKRVIRLY